MVRVGRRLSLLFVCIAASHEVEEEVELDGEVGLDGVCAVACADERRLDSLALLPQVTTHAVAYLAVVEVANKEVGVLVVNPAGNVLDAQSVASTFKQNLDNIPMVDVIHSANIHFSAQRYKKSMNYEL